MESHRLRSALVLSRRRRRWGGAGVSVAALVVAAPLLTGCGNDAHPGAAAVVGDSRITTGDLQASVKQVRAAQRDAPRGEEMIKHTGQLSRATLNRMIHDRVVDRAGEDSGVSVSRRDVQSARAQFERQVGGSKQFEAALLQEEMVAPGGVEDWVRTQVIIQELVKEAGIDPSTREGNQQLARKLARVSEKMDIDVNPRYGKWDAKQAVLGDSKESWLKDRTGERLERAQAQGAGVPS